MLIRPTVMVFFSVPHIILSNCSMTSISLFPQYLVNSFLSLPGSRELFLRECFKCNLGHNFYCFYVNCLCIYKFDPMWL